MKPFLILIVSLSLSIDALAQSGRIPLGQDSSLANKVSWQDVAIIQRDSLYFMNGANGEFFLHRRKNVNSIKDFNEKEIKEIKKNTASCGATIAYVSFAMSDNGNIYYGNYTLKPLSPHNSNLSNEL